VDVTALQKFATDEAQFLRFLTRNEYAHATRAHTDKTYTNTFVHRCVTCMHISECSVVSVWNYTCTERQREGERGGERERGGGRERQRERERERVCICIHVE